MFLSHLNCSRFDPLSILPAHIVISLVNKTPKKEKMKKRNPSFPAATTISLLATHELVSALGVFLFWMGRCMLNLSAAGNNLLSPPHLIPFSRFLFPFPASPCAEREKPCKSFPPPPPLFFAGDGEFALFPCPLFCHLSAVEGRESETDFPHNGEKNRKWEKREKEKPQLNRRRKGGEKRRRSI